MLNSISTIFFYILCALIGYSLFKPWLSSDKSAIWSPITMISLTLVYYIVMPSFGDISNLGASLAQGQHLFYIAAVLFYVCVLIGFSLKGKAHFKNWNHFFTISNAQRVGILLFILALACYVPFRGFRTTIWAEDAGLVAERT